MVKALVLQAAGPEHLELGSQPARAAPCQGTEDRRDTQPTRAHQLAGAGHVCRVWNWSSGRRGGQLASRDTHLREDEHTVSLIPQLLEHLL